MFFLCGDVEIIITNININKVNFMMKLSCKDIDPTMDCSFEAMGNTEGEVASKMMAHVKAKHPDAAKSMSDNEMMSMFKEKVHS
jgi:predicted small metal-binding protein